MVHLHLGAETAVAKIGPVTDFSIADANDIGEPVAGEVGEEDRLGAVGQENGGSGLFVEGLQHGGLRAESIFGERRMPAEHLFLGNENVGMAVAGQVNEFKVRIVPVE